ncbi:MAG TPA: HAD family hydrolase [Kofleriaceae bacterium]|nr:HAD family hydrolase [Kofleriaceae bacterium]
MKPAARRALFIDRDGTLIVDVGYPREPARVEPLPGALDALRGLAASFALVIVSNQSGIARGLITPAEARAVHERTIELFAHAGVGFAGAYYCPHAPDAGCPCRKPQPGLLLDAARELELDLARSSLVGDRASDVAAGRAAGCCHVIRLGPAAGDAHEPRCEDWAEVVRFLGAEP